MNAPRVSRLSSDAPANPGAVGQDCDTAPEGDGHEQLWQGFRAAMDRATPRHTVDYQFGGRRARLRVVGELLAREFHRPFAHLALPPGNDDPPALTVDLWDESASGVPTPLPPPLSDPGAIGHIEPSSSGRFVMYARAGTRFSLDRAARHIVGWVADARQLTQFERGRPFMGALHLWHQDRDLHAVHAGLVARNDQGVLFGGASGSGKTTSALACLAAGFTYLGDDYAGLAVPADGLATGHSVFCSTHIAPVHLHRFPFLAVHAQPGSLPVEDKSLVILSDVVPGRLGRSTPIAALVLPRVIGRGAVAFRRASRPEALLRIAPSSVFVQRASIKGRQALDKLEALVQRTPAYWLDLGAEVRDIPGAVHAILDEVAA